MSGYDYGGGGRRAGSPQYAVVANYSTYSATFSSFDSPNEQKGSGTGYSIGAEVNRPTLFLSGMWILGAYYTAQNSRAKLSSGIEDLEFQSIHVPLAWGFKIASTFYLGGGLMFKYGIDKITRTTPSGTSKLTYDDYGLDPVQVEALAIARVYISLKRKRQIFADFKFASGLRDRAIGSDDKWEDSESFFGLGFLF